MSGRFLLCINIIRLGVETNRMGTIRGVEPCRHGCETRNHLYAACCIVRGSSLNNFVLIGLHVAVYCENEYIHEQIKVFLRHPV